MMLADPALSRAGSLPQLFRGTEESGAAVIPVGVSLLAIAVRQSATMLKLVALSRAGSLLQGTAVISDEVDEPVFMTLLFQSAL
jgi:hypothetical protein